MELKRTISLRTLFMQFLIILICLLMLSVSLPTALLFFGVRLGIFTPASANEALIQQAQGEVSSAPVFSKELIPGTMEYALYDKSIALLETNMDEKYEETATLYAKGLYNNANSNIRFLLITREEEYVVLKYTVRSGYQNQTLNHILPAPEVVVYILIITNILVSCIAATLLFARKVRRQILPLHNAARQISEQNLDFNIEHSQIKELNDVLMTFGEMKEELRTSLEKQWKEEQSQREQIAALSHDLKTPLTVVLGNVDLLQETKLDDEQDLYVNRILSHSEYMEQSIQTLIELSRTGTNYTLQIHSVEFVPLLEIWKEKINGLAFLKEIQVEYRFYNLPTHIRCDSGLLERAILNIVSNGVDFTPLKAAIRIEILGEEDRILFTITDSGTGFSKEALASGTKRFYMEDSSRTSRNHYGMGLTIADQIVRQHGGHMELMNGTEDLTGAKIIISIPS